MSARRVRLPAGRVWLRVAKDVRTALLQVEGMLQGSPAGIDDLAHHAFTLVAATLPRDQTAADAVSADAVRDEEQLRWLETAVEYQRAAEAALVAGDEERAVHLAVLHTTPGRASSTDPGR